MKGLDDYVMTIKGKDMLTEVEIDHFLLPDSSFGPNIKPLEVDDVLPSSILHQSFKAHNKIIEETIEGEKRQLVWEII